MSQNFLPAAASVLFALVGAPALAASEIADELVGSDASLDTAADMTTAADDQVAEKARGGGNKGGAKRSGAPAGAKPAAQGGQARAPAAGGPAARPASQGAARRAPSAQSNARAANHTAARSPGQTASRSAPQRSSGGQPSAARSAGSQAHRANGTQGPRTATTSHTNARSGAATPARANNGAKAANHVARGKGHAPATHSRPGAKRPGAKRHSAARPGRHVTVTHHSRLPARWNPAYHRTNVRGVPHWHPHYWATGVFIYSPPPPRHSVVVVDSGSGHRVSGAAAEPTRAVNRNGDVSVGMRAGSYMSGYQGGASFGDMGLGAALRYRPAESLGFELSWQHTSSTWDDSSERESDPINASVELFAFPWSRVSPYAMGGLTWTPRSVTETYSDGFSIQSYEANDTLFGPHFGVGLELAVGKNASLNFEGKATSYLNVPMDDPTVPAALQGTMGLNYYF